MEPYQAVTNDNLRRNLKLRLTENLGKTKLFGRRMSARPVWLWPDTHQHN